MEQHMSLQQSTNYIWDVADLLGSGACGNVYRGLKKENAEPVAVKVYSAAANQRAVEIQLRELTVIQKLKHENIVKLLDIEREERTRKTVIVMELCTGGSLLKILEDPENCWGVSEDEFLLVLDHVSAGTQYLRQEKIVHRDLKPANIMKFVGDDGRSVYKLIDFDSARHLEDNQEFFSLYGTEEYLHPDMYEQYLLPSDNAPLKRFSASNDLWSVGATFYHVATGKLPFRPYQRRKDPKTMHQMTAKKAPGVISAHQQTRNGKIMYEKELPETCKLSFELKTLITPLLAHLMEVDPRKKYSYDQFFNAVEEILSRKRIYIFHVNKVETFRLYVNTNTQGHYNHILDTVAEHTKISPQNQILLYKGRTVFSMLENGNLTTEALPVTTANSPLFLCSRDEADVRLDFVAPPNFFSFSNVPDAVKDYETSRYNCAVGHDYKRNIETTCLSAHLLGQAVHTISQVVILHLTTVAKEHTHIKSVINSLNNQFEMMKIFLEVSKDFLKNTDSTASTLEQCIQKMENLMVAQKEQFSQLNDRLVNLNPAIDYVVGSRVGKRSLASEWEKEYSQIPNISNFHCTRTSAATIIEKLRQSYYYFSSSEAAVTSGQNGNSYYYLLQRMKMDQQNKGMKKVYENDCKVMMSKLVDVFSDWFKNAQAAFFQPEILAKDIIALRTDVTKCEKELESVVTEFNQQLKNMSQALRFVEKVPKIPENGKQAAKRLHTHIKALTAVHQEIHNNSRENLDLCSELSSLMENSLRNLNQQNRGICD